MRFICEWCFEKIAIDNVDSPHAEILDHYTNCPARPSSATEKHVAGLAAHMAGVIAEHEEFEAKIRNSC